MDRNVGTYTHIPTYIYTHTCKNSKNTEKTLCITLHLIYFIIFGPCKYTF